MEKSIQLYSKGVHNLLDSEIIPTEAASDSLNWFTQDGRIKLVNGKERIGQAGVAGKITGEIFGYKADSTKVHFRKAGTKIQYLSGTTWTDIITGLTSTADYTFSNYSSLAGTFVYATGVDGLYKIHTANPGSYIDMFDSAINFKGQSIIDKGRMLMWGLDNDTTALRGSKIDITSADTTVTNEVLGTGTGAQTTFTGTLAFKAGNPKATCYDIAINTNPAGITGQDNNVGVFIGTGLTGTINYTTGAYSITFTVAPALATQVRATYVHQNTNSGGITDFTRSATRLAGEGFRVPQDEGGDPILNVLIGTNGYYSMKSQSTYLLTIDSTDLVINNNVYRKELGLPSARACVSTGKGIIFMNSANPEKPEMNILQKNATGDSVEPFTLFTQFKFSNYDYDDCTIDTYERYILVACKTQGASANDIILLCDLSNETVDITGYNARTFARNNGDLFMGSSITENIYNLYNGYDDDGNTITNYWIGKSETWGTDNLKKYRKIRLKGNIGADQSYQVLLNYDNTGFQLVGTVLGSASYVDYTNPQTIGSSMIGTEQIGGAETTNIYPYFMEIRLKKVPKFRNRQIKFIAQGIGYLDIDSQLDLDIDTYEMKLPPRFREKQNVSLNGLTTNNANPEF